jgi:hypothetical protein
MNTNRSSSRRQFIRSGALLSGAGTIGLVTTGVTTAGQSEFGYTGESTFDRDNVLKVGLANNYGNRTILFDRLSIDVDTVTWLHSIGSHFRGSTISAPLAEEPPATFDLRHVGTQGTIRGGPGYLSVRSTENIEGMDLQFTIHYHEATQDFREEPYSRELAFEVTADTSPADFSATELVTRGVRL